MNAKEIRKFFADNIKFKFKKRNQSFLAEQRIRDMETNIDDEVIVLAWELYQNLPKMYNLSSETFFSSGAFSLTPHGVCIFTTYMGDEYAIDYENYEDCGSNKSYEYLKNKGFSVCEESCDYMPHIFVTKNHEWFFNVINQFDKKILKEENSNVESMLADFNLNGGNYCSYESGLREDRELHKYFCKHLYEEDYKVYLEFKRS